MPVMSAGIRSGVNWMRLNDSSSASGQRLDEQRLGQAGHADEQAVPAREQRDQQVLDRPVSWPTMRLPISASQRPARRRDLAPRRPDPAAGSAKGRGVGPGSSTTSPDGVGGNGATGELPALRRSDIRLRMPWSRRLTLRPESDSDMRMDIAIKAVSSIRLRIPSV